MPAQEKENEKDPSAALGMTIRKGLPHFFIPLRKPPLSPFKYPHRMAAGAGCIFGVFGMV